MEPTDQQVAAAAAAAVGMTTARFHLLADQQRAIVREWQLAEEGDEQVCLLASITWSLMLALLEELSEGLGSSDMDVELLVPPRPSETARMALHRWLVEAAERGELDDSDVPAALRQEFGDVRILDAMVEDILQLVVWRAALAQRTVSEQLALLGASASTNF